MQEVKRVSNVRMQEVTRVSNVRIVLIGSILMLLLSVSFFFMQTVHPRQIMSFLQVKFHHKHLLSPR